MQGFSERGLSEDQVKRGFALVRAARAILDGLPPRKVSAATCKKYEGLYANMVKQGKMPEQIAKTRRSYYVYRAATNFMVPQLLADCLRAADRAFKAKDGDRWWGLIQDARASLGILQRYAPDPNRARLISREKSSVPVPRGKNRSKRVGLSKLPTDWRERFWGVVSKRSVYRAAIAATMLTGVRPAELVSGIKVELGENGELIFTIRGAKTQGGLYGQQARQLTISSDSEMAVYLGSIVERSGPQVVKISDARLLGNQISAYSKKCWPRHDIRISPYSFRHQFAADLKAAGDADAVSLALGHAVADTAQHYGTARQARPTGARLLRVTTTRQLKKERKLEKTRQLERLKMRLGPSRTLARGRKR